MQAAAAAAVLAFAGAAQAATGASAATAQASSAAATAGAASGASAAAPALPVIGQYTVHPGQSLHDVAVDVTQSHDKTTLARASQALFDANPNSFMKHDPSRLKVGATLDVPGTPDMASGASGVTPVSAPVAAAASSTVPEASAAAASAVATANAAVATSGAASASMPEAAASATIAASASASATTGASAPAAAAQASDAHSWSGAVQVAPSSAASASATPAQVKVSSLQQLLALKNRVLMALQHHGAKPAQVAGAAPAGANSGATAGAAAGANDAQPEVLPITWAVVAAVLLAFVALIVRLFTRKRRKAAPLAKADAPAAHAVAHEAAEQDHEDAEQDNATVLRAAPTPSAEAPHHDAGFDHAADAASLSAAAELGADALPPTLFEPPHAETADGPAELHADRTEHGIHPQGVEAGEPQSLADATDAASLAAAGELGASALPIDGATSQRTVGEADELARETEAEAEAESEAEGEAERHAQTETARHSDEPQLPAAVPPAIGAEPRSIELAMPGDELEASLRQAGSHAAAEPEPTSASVEPAAPLEPAAEAQHAAPVVPDVPVVPQEQEMAQLEVPKEFPKSAVDALGSLDMPLPPRVDVPEFPQTGSMPNFAPPIAPVATPGAIARQSLPFAEPPAPPVGKAIEAGTAGFGSIAGLGAAMGTSPVGAPPMGTPRFGTLSLDFDLNLPPDSAEPLPVFTPEQLARIARNKLDLAYEYIELGDLAGARALINEVIESNDHATRADAQALLSTLSPLS
ncbi:FimV-like protein [Paraburkholderia bannensis]|uniref:FimV-like protein n=1 Tax=Paraburkholderia bannensis TaxID=765414 RepID=A0A7W9TV44_9BURK|nr:MULTISPECIES: FimV/HubP family polar landmark protein [Paraburkholderia]MBB3257034.1 FimV-like protein [Paraburkholderia sp. WP4_3_2]MBB6101988.1 FimV-like protein [Paraburkholderia bannensis]